MRNDNPARWSYRQQIGCSCCRSVGQKNVFWHNQPPLNRQQVGCPCRPNFRDAREKWETTNAGASSGGAGTWWGTGIDNVRPGPIRKVGRVHNRFIRITPSFNGRVFRIELEPDDQSGFRYGNARSALFPPDTMRGSFRKRSWRPWITSRAPMRLRGTRGWFPVNHCRAAPHGHCEWEDGGCANGEGVSRWRMRYPPGHSKPSHRALRVS